MAAHKRNSPLRHIPKGPSEPPRIPDSQAAKRGVTPRSRAGKPAERGKGERKTGDRKRGT